MTQPAAMLIAYLGFKIFFSERQMAISSVKCYGIGGKSGVRASSAMLVSAVGGRFAAFVHAVIAKYRRDPQPVIVEDAAAAARLRAAVLFQVAPVAHRFFI